MTLAAMAKTFVAALKRSPQVISSGFRNKILNASKSELHVALRMRAMFFAVTVNMLMIVVVIEAIIPDNAPSLKEAIRAFNFFFYILKSLFERISNAPEKFSKIKVSSHAFHNFRELLAHCTILRSRADQEPVSCLFLPRWQSRACRAFQKLRAWVVRTSQPPIIGSARYSVPCHHTLTIYAVQLLQFGEFFLLLHIAVSEQMTL